MIERQPAQVSHLGAITLAIAGFTCYVLCDSVIKLAGNAHLPNFEILAFLGVFITLFVWLYSLIRGRAKELWPKRPQRLVVRSCLDVGNNICVVIALRHLSLTLFYILVFTSPMVVAILGRVFLNERLDWRKALAIVAGFLGVVVAVVPSRAAGGSALIGFLACTVCVSCFSVGIVWTRTISQTESPESITFMSGLVTGLVGLAGCLVSFRPPSTSILVALLVMGLLGVIGNYCTFTALKHTTAATVSQYHYTQLLFGAIAGYVLFHELPTVWMLAGAILIIAAGLYIAVRKPMQVTAGM